MSDFDPGEYTVDEVKTYVEEHPDEVDDVLEKEVGGKDRSTLVNWLGKFGSDDEPDEPEESDGGENPGFNPHNVEAPEEPDRAP